jgi:hemerythrin superfamily protein
MSTFDKVVAAVTPPETEQQRADARAKARAAAAPGDWLSLILDHHEQIEDAFAAVKTAEGAHERTAALRALGVLLTGHAIAEEAVVYPALAQAGEKGHATMAYTEQAAAKMQIAALEILDPLSQDFEDKLGHLEGAVAHHVYEEEGKWFPELVEAASPEDSERITERYREEFDRYIDGGEPGGSAYGGVVSEPRAF